MPPTSGRDEFFRNIRSALGRTQASPAPVDIDEATALSQDSKSVADRAESLRVAAEVGAEDLLSQLEDSATQAGWKVVRAANARDAGRYIADLARDLEARSILRSAHGILDTLELGGLLSGSGIALDVMAIEEGVDERGRDEQRRLMRERAAAADIGVTGVDYAIAETGTCVLLARKGVSRLVSLLPPVHVAVVQRTDILPSLDELFTLRRDDFLHGELGSYMTLISGPSRTADIEYTLVTGVHGPGEVHMVMIG